MQLKLPLSLYLIFTSLGCSIVHFFKKVQVGYLLQYEIDDLSATDDNSLLRRPDLIRITEL